MAFPGKSCIFIYFLKNILYRNLYIKTEAFSHKHGYIKNLKKIADLLDAEIVDYRLLDFSFNPLNPSGVVSLLKDPTKEVTSKIIRCNKTYWRCPITGSKLEKSDDAFFSKDYGLAYPILKGIPLLRAQHAVVASSYGNSFFPEV